LFGFLYLTHVTILLYRFIFKELIYDLTRRMTSRLRLRHSTSLRLFAMETSNSLFAA